VRILAKANVDHFRHATLELPPVISGRRGQSTSGTDQLCATLPIGLPKRPSRYVSPRDTTYPQHGRYQQKVERIRNKCYHGRGEEPSDARHNWASERLEPTLRS
jgi:hypothetical protein